MITVTLTDDQAAFAAAIGCARYQSAFRHHRADRHGAAHQSVFQRVVDHVQGAPAELAAAIALRVEWPGTVGTFKTDPDLPPDWEIRLRLSHAYDLIVRDDDPPERRYVLVTGHLPTFRVHGWITGTDARRDEWLADHGGHGLAWFVPQTALTPVEHRRVTA